MTDAEATRWEDETVRPPRDETKKEATEPTDRLNERATEGWRVVETVEYTGGGTKFFLMERPAQPPDEADDE